MSQKNDIPVVINNKVYTLSGFVSLPKVTAVLMQNIRVYYLHLISQMITSKRSFR